MADEEGELGALWWCWWWWAATAAELLCWSDCGVRDRLLLPDRDRERDLERDRLLLLEREW